MHKIDIIKQYSIKTILDIVFINLNLRWILRQFQNNIGSNVCSGYMLVNAVNTDMQCCQKFRGLYISPKLVFFNKKHFIISLPIFSILSQYFCNIDVLLQLFPITIVNQYRYSIRSISYELNPMLAIFRAITVTKINFLLRYCQ